VLIAEPKLTKSAPNCAVPAGPALSPEIDKTAYARRNF
jgi:hypothetical protein